MILLIYPPVAKPGEPPAGIARLAAALDQQGVPSTMLDANMEGLEYLFNLQRTPGDTWSIRAERNLKKNLGALRSPELYHNTDRYQRAVRDVNRVLELTTQDSASTSLSLANYQDANLSPLVSKDLLHAAAHYRDNIYFPYYSQRINRIIEKDKPSMIGLSLNYLSQAICTFALLGFLKDRFPGLPLVLGGGLITSWLSNPQWINPFSSLVDHLIAGPGELPLLKLAGKQARISAPCPDYTSLPRGNYLAPGLILPYAASSGCYWNRCSFCPEQAEKSSYRQVPIREVQNHLRQLRDRHQPTIIHLLDNAVSPALLRALIAEPPGVPWYGFARVSKELADPVFCRDLRRSGCLMLKLGLESGSQRVLDTMDKGIKLPMVSQTLNSLHQAGIATYVYLLFGTPAEAEEEALQTLNFVASHHPAITFLNLAIFNLPINSPDAQTLELKDFYHGDLSLYRDFVHPRGWNRKAIRRFLDKQFKRHPSIAPILHRDPPLFTSNHAPFFTPGFKHFKK